MKKLIPLILLAFATSAVSLRAGDGKAVFDKNCKKCHGENGKGKTAMGRKFGVKDYTDAKVQAAITDETMSKNIKEGIKKGDETRMKAFGESLSDDEIKALVTYMRSFKGQ